MAAHPIVEHSWELNDPTAPTLLGVPARRSRAGGRGRRPEPPPSLSSSLSPLSSSPDSLQQRHATGPPLGNHSEISVPASSGAVLGDLGSGIGLTVSDTCPVDGVAESAAADAARLLARRDRYYARSRLSGLTGLRRVAACGRVPVTDDGAVYLRARTGDDRKAGFGGLATCGSVWTCPVCSAKIAVRRVAEVGKLLRWNDDRGGSSCMATFTMSHNKGHRLKTLWEGLSGAWAYMTQGRAGETWRKVRDLFGSDGYVRATEGTYGDENGWHIHIHLLMIFKGAVSDSAMRYLTDELYKLWSRGLELRGFTASRRHGVDVRRCRDTAQSFERVADYFNKMTFEMAGGRFKKGRKGGRTPFEVLADGLETGLADDLEIWLEWEQASKGRRQLVWSRGLKARSGIEDLTDEEIAEAADEGETLLILPRRTWQAIRDFAVELLDATEAGGLAAAMIWLEDRELLYEVPDVGFLSRQTTETGQPDH